MTEFQAEHTLSVAADAPIPAATLREFVAAIPDHAAVTVTPREGGSQRDPYTTGYALLAKWKDTELG